MKASEFDKLFDEGKDVSSYLNLKGAKMEHPIQRINIDIPQEMLFQVDKEAARIGVPRTSLLKLWIAERIDTL
ncbi:MAG: CopG family transcriptional regulator [Gammaproteobacteria bacterium]|nr:CopG family transcriptional regulator [Gammaproteobacteria bacterium]